MTYPGTIPKTFTDFWKEAAANPNDPRHELAKEMLRKKGLLSDEPENTEHDPIDDEPDRTEFERKYDL